MPRKRPGRLRTLHPRALRPGDTIPQVDRVSASTLRAIAELERTRLRAGAIAESVRRWAVFVRSPARELDDCAPEPCPCPNCQRRDPVVCRAELRTALHALPTTAARELRTLVQPLDETYLARALPDPKTAHIREMLTIAPSRTRFQPQSPDAFSVELDLVHMGWLLAVLGSTHGERRLYASYLTPALDDLLAALVRVTTGHRHERLSWDSEPSECRWLITVDPFAHAHVRILEFPDRIAEQPDREGHEILHSDVPLRTLVRSVATAARALLTRVGEDGYARRWRAGRFPQNDLRALEHWLRRPTT